jgi:hypothetical protein
MQCRDKPKVNTKKTGGAGAVKDKVDIKSCIDGGKKGQQKENNIYDSMCQRRTNKINSKAISKFKLNQIEPQQQSIS